MTTYTWTEIPDELNSINFEANFRSALEEWRSNMEDIDVRLLAGDYPDYIWADAAARAAQTGMVEDERGFQQDTGSIYRYESGTWTLKYYTFPLGLTTDGTDITITNDLYVSGDIYGSGDLNIGGNEFLQSKTILDQQVAPYYNFNGSSGKIQVTDDASFAGIFDNGGTAIIKLNAFSYGEGNLGRIIHKIYFFACFNSDNQFKLYHFFSGDDAEFRSVETFEYGKDSIFVVSYDNSSTSNVPAVTVDGVPITMTVYQAPTGTANTDVGSDLYIGNNHLDSATFDGNIYDVIFLNRELTAAEAISFSGNPQKALDWKDEGGSNAQYVSDFSADVDGWTNTNSTGVAGVTLDGKTNCFKIWANGSSSSHFGYRALELTPGKQYRLTGYFQVPAGQTHADGFAIGDGVIVVARYESTNGSWVYVDEVFTSTGYNLIVYLLDGTITGFTGANSSSDDYICITDITLAQLGATLVLKGEDATDSTWYDSSGNGNDGAVTTATRHNKQDSLQLNKLVLDDGGTIGQAAGPLLTFDDTNNYLKITGCNVGIGTDSPESGIRLTVFDDANTQIDIQEGNNTVGNSSRLSFKAQNSSNEMISYAKLISGIVTNTDGSEDGSLDIYITEGGNEAKRVIGFEADGDVEIVSGRLMVNCLTNANMIQGITINQGPADDEILALKSSDVAHGMTTIAETDTFASFSKWSATGGGIFINGLGEGGIGFVARGLCITPSTVDTSGGYGTLRMIAAKADGTGIQSLGATDNLMSIDNNGTTIAIWKGNGDLHVTNTTLVALDDEDDIALSLAAKDMMTADKVGITDVMRKKLTDVGVFNEAGDMINLQRMQALQFGTVGQLINIFKGFARHFDIPEDEVMGWAKQYS